MMKEYTVEIKLDVSILADSAETAEEKLDKILEKLERIRDIDSIYAGDLTEQGACSPVQEIFGRL